MAKKKPFKPTRKEIKTWKETLSKRAKKRYESLKSTKAKHEFMKRSMAAKRGYETRIKNITPSTPIIKQVIETESDIYEGLISEIYTSFKISSLPPQLEQLMIDTMDVNKLNITDYLNKLNLDKISRCLDVIKYDSDRNLIKTNIIQLAEELSLHDLPDSLREYLSDLIEQEY